MPEDYPLIEEAITYLEQNFRQQPTLDELGAHLGVSPFHLQRVFKRWAGISPKRFVQFLTVEHAKGLLEESRTVLDTAYESGLSGPGRLYDLFVTVEAVTPAEFRAKGAGLRIHYGFHPSPFGECLLASTERGICWLSFGDRADRADSLTQLHEHWSGARLTERPDATGLLIDRVFPRAPDDGSARPLTLLVKGTNFQIKVWEALLKIPPGLICSYQDIAAQVGKPRGARAVGNAVAANPISYIIPCHRVIRKSGVIGNYRWNTARKRAIIGWESAHAYAHTQTNPEEEIF
jgi:AraC family transcriptional regulator of adaptative response/methylated-DNA-[protein]-cysteine methyltransferase